MPADVQVTSHQNICMAIMDITMFREVFTIFTEFTFLHVHSRCCHCYVAHLPAGEDASPDAGWAHDLTRGAVAAALHEVRRKAEP